MDYLSLEKVKRCLTSVGVLVKDGKVLMVYHEDYGKWLLPGGHIKNTETPNQTVEREFFEETGLKVEVIGEKQVFDVKYERESLVLPFHVEVHPINKEKCKQHVAFVYWVKVVGDISEIFSSEPDVTDYKWVGLEDLKVMGLIDNMKKIVRFAIKNYPAEKRRPSLMM